MNARDEAIAVVVASELAQSSSTGRALEFHEQILTPMVERHVDALIAEGWRKMPSREAVEQAFANSWDDATEYEGAVDAILALMEADR